MKRIQSTTLQERLENYTKQSKSLSLKPLQNPKLLIPLSSAFLAGIHAVDAQIVYSGAKNVSCALAGNTNRCYANIDGAGGNDFEFHRNHAFGNQFIQIDEVPGGGFAITGFHAKVVGIYVYPYANAAGVVIGAGGPWGFQSGQANSLSEINNAYPNDAWTPLANGTTRFVGIRGTVGGQTKYGWLRLTKNGFGNYTIVDWAYNNTTGAPITTGMTVLPVEMISFKAKLDNSTVHLAWKTASEKDNSGYEVQRSDDGKKYQSVGWIEGKGTTAEAQEYTFDDKNIRDGKIYYYRLRQVDYNGKFEYSQIVSVKVGEKGTTLGDFYPNPSANGRVTLDFNTLTPDTWTVSVFNASGQSVHTEQRTVVEGINTLAFNFTRIPKGLYYIKMDNGTERFYKKLMIQ